MSIGHASSLTAHHYATHTQCVYDLEHVRAAPIYQLPQYNVYL